MTEIARIIRDKDLQQQAEADGRICVVGAFIRNTEGRIFVMQRAPTRALFPNCWDLVGGHVEPGETLIEALGREIHEETGWTLSRIVALVTQFDWEDAWDTSGRRRREFDFLVEVDGDLGHPHIERDNFTQYRWVGPDDSALLMENRDPTDQTILHIIQQALTLATQT